MPDYLLNRPTCCGYTQQNNRYRIELMELLMQSIIPKKAKKILTSQMLTLFFGSPGIITCDMFFDLEKAQSKLTFRAEKSIRE